MEPSWSSNGWMAYDEFRAYIRDYDGTGPLDRSFGPVPGVYLLAHGDARPNSSGDEMHLDPAVIYIGKSANLRARLRRHNKVCHGFDCYMMRYKDARLEKLFAAAYVCDNRFNVVPRTVENRLLHDFESGRLREYVAKYGERPNLNQRGGRPKSSPRLRA